MGALSTPQQALTKMLQEELKENSVKLGVWMAEGYWKQGRRTVTVTYNPLLKLVDHSASWSNVGRKSQFNMVKMQRPSILDVDNLFAATPNTPTTMRTSLEVCQDMYYQGQQYGRGLTTNCYVNGRNYFGAQ